MTVRARGMLVWAALGVFGAAVAAAHAGEAAPVARDSESVGVSDPVGEEALARALRIEQHRIEVIARVMPAVVAIFDEEQTGGGSGVIIDSRGYGLTNFHVVAGMMATRRGLGGLSDGRLYPLEVLGVDITGDVAMFRLTGRDSYPTAPLGDSDEVAPGDPVIAMGNPFTLAEDYTPTVTAGIVTGVHRYQGESETLVYSDAIQVDASINPGNSGGPLFDSEGGVIGINGRISAQMHKYARGRFNVGLGYAITINQIKRFIPTLRAGLLGKHGTMLATVMDDGDDVVFNDMYRDGPAYLAGIRVGDRVKRMGGVEIRSANRFLGVLGTYPDRWPLPITVERQGRAFHRLVRLEAVLPPMKGEYVVPPDVHDRALQELIERVRGAVIPSDRGIAGAIVTLRTVRVNDEGEAISDRACRYTAGPEVACTEYEDGRAVREQTLDLESGRWTAGDTRRLASREELLYCRAWRVLLKEVIGGGRIWEKQPPRLRHAGADAVVEMDDQGELVSERLLESIEWIGLEDVTLWIGFDVQTGVPARVEVVDRPSQVRVEMVLSGEPPSPGQSTSIGQSKPTGRKKEADAQRGGDAWPWGGLRLPARVRIRQGRDVYQETITAADVTFE